MQEIIFIVKESEEGGYIASALNESIFTDGESLQELKSNVKEAVQCHFDDDTIRCNYPYQKLALACILP